MKFLFDSKKTFTLFLFCLGMGLLTLPLSTYAQRVPWKGMAGVRGTEGVLSKLWMLDSTTGWAVGANGTILKFNGSSWESQPSGTTKWLHSVWGSDAKNVWAVGDSGTILQYNGSSWSIQTSGTKANLYGVWTCNAKTVWVVGDTTTILHYNGRRWETHIPSNYYRKATLWSVWGSDANNVFAVGDDQTLLKFDSSYFGKPMWYSLACRVNGNPQDPNIRAKGFYTSVRNLYCVWGSDSNNVWFGGDVGNVIRYYRRKGSPDQFVFNQKFMSTETIYGLTGFKYSPNPRHPDIEDVEVWAVGTENKILFYMNTLSPGNEDLRHWGQQSNMQNKSDMYIYTGIGGYSRDPRSFWAVGLHHRHRVGSGSQIVKFERRPDGFMFLKQWGK